MKYPRVGSTIHNPSFRCLSDYLIINCTLLFHNSSVLIKVFIRSLNFPKELIYMVNKIWWTSSLLHLQYLYTATPIITEITILDDTAAAPMIVIWPEDAPEPDCSTVDVKTGLDFFVENVDDPVNMFFFTFARSGQTILTEEFNFILLSPLH